MKAATETKTKKTGYFKSKTEKTDLKTLDQNHKTKTPNATLDPSTLILYYQAKQKISLNIEEWNT